MRIVAVDNACPPGRLARLLGRSLFLLVFLTQIAFGTTESEMIRLYNEGTAYYFGHGRPVDHTTACDLFEQSATLGYATAQFNLGNCFRSGKGRPYDLEVAERWYRAAADQHFPDAITALGILLVAQSDARLAEGVDLLRMTAATDPYAMFYLGVVHTKPEYSDAPKAFQYFCRRQHKATCWRLDSCT